MLSHSFDRFYVVAIFKLPRLADLRLLIVEVDSKCSCFTGNDTQKNSYFPKLLAYCLKIMPYIEFYKKQIEYCNHTAYELLMNEIGLILPTFQKKKTKRGAILASVLGGIASCTISLAYEGISSFLHHKRHKALNKAMKVMERTDLQHNKIHHLEENMIMYGVFNSDTLTELIDTVHRMHNTTM